MPGFGKTRKPPYLALRLILLFFVVAIFVFVFTDIAEVFSEDVGQFRFVGVIVTLFGGRLLLLLPRNFDFRTGIRPKAPKSRLVKQSYS